MMAFSAHPGHYESFWHFYHNGRRFGPWLGCQVIVDPSPVAPQSSSTEPESTPTWSARKKLKMDEHEMYDPLINNGDTELACKASDKKDIGLGDVQIKVENVSTELKELKIIEDDVVNTSSDSDNQSIVSIFDSNSSMNSGCSDEFVLVAMPQRAFKEQGDQESDKADDKASVELVQVSEQDTVEKGNCH